MQSVWTFLAVILGTSILVESKWDGLRVTWGPVPKLFFKSQPRTKNDSLAAGFKLVDTGVCGATSRYAGIAYAKDGDYALTLLYDKNGYIAGIQAGITQNQYKKTGFPHKEIRPPFVPDGVNNTRFVLTAYFTDPSKICTTGRTADEFARDGTGTGLWLQTGEYADNVVKIPEFEKDVATPWVKGKCFWTMGVHYWYDISYNMDCKSFYPVFLLYNKGKLNSFGWAFPADLNSSHFEHPGAKTFGLFMETVPECMTQEPKVSTMHIFMTNEIGDNKC